jgi:hypothetical protein
MALDSTVMNALRLADGRAATNLGALNAEP